MDTDQYKNETAKSMTKIWKVLNDEQREDLVKEMIIVHPQHGEIIFQNGDEPMFMFYLVAGSVNIYQSVGEDRRHLVRIVEPGGIFGMQSAFSSEYYKYDAVAGNDAVIVILPLMLVFHLIWESPEFALLFIQELSDLLGTSIQYTIHLTKKLIRGRLAESILRVKEKFGTEADGCTLPIYLSRSDLALMSNMTTSNAIRTLSAFANEKIILLKGRKISILDEAKLQRISETE